MRIMALPPTETNLYLYVRRAHLQTMLWKAADQQGPPNVDITTFGWELTEGIPSPCIVTGLHAPQCLIDVINCACKAQGKACSTEHSRWVLLPIYNEGRDDDQQAEYESEEELCT